MKRVRRDKSGGAYFSSPKTNIEFIPSGCKILDLALGGGWARRRVSNIIGDKSSGKTLLCIEAAANFAIVEPKGKIRYREAESAFLPDYAGALGMPLDRVDFGSKPLETVEHFYEDLNDCIRKARAPELYILDSLDALSDQGEMERKFGAASFGAEKAKKMSQLFRELNTPMSEADVTLMIVSQVRSNIGVKFGKKITRSGGRALDFYASQVVMLVQLARIMKTISKIKRPIGVEILAKVEKNKIALPYREAAFDILFGYGVNDAKACLDWMHNAGFLKTDTNINPAGITLSARNMMHPDHKDQLDDLRKMVERRWFELETEFLPKYTKYQRS